MVSIDKEFAKSLITWIVILICVLGFAICLVKCNTKAYVPPIVETDSLNKQNIELKKELNNLDSVKYEKINEVKHLDNDSTLKLFYKLIGK